MTAEKSKGFDYFTLGIILSILFIILSIVWVTVTNLFDNDNPDVITWVG